MDKPERFVGRGMFAAPAGEVNRKLPKADAILPGATAAPLA
jgi:hypothetical protein